MLTRERLIDEVWDSNWFGSTKTLDVHVSSPRKAKPKVTKPATSPKPSTAPVATTTATVPKPVSTVESHGGSGKGKSSSSHRGGKHSDD